MSKLTITLEVDQSQLFDALISMSGDTKALGARLAAVLMSGDISLFEEVCLLGRYGIKIVEMRGEKRTNDRPA